MFYLLGEGVEIDSIESSLNKTCESFLRNEKLLQINQNILDENDQKLEKGHDL